MGFRHFPLEMIHPSAMRAAEAAECGKRQGKFWEIHDALFARPEKLTPRHIDALRSVDSLDAASFDRCLKEGASQSVRQDLSDARALGISGTPTFLFGVRNDAGALRVMRRESGAIPFETVASILDEMIGRADDTQRGDR